MTHLTRSIHCVAGFHLLIQKNCVKSGNTGSITSLGSILILGNLFDKTLDVSCHSMRRGAGRGAGRGKPDGPKRVPISLGFKCVHCRNEFDSKYAMDIHRRHISSAGTPCADPRNHKSMSFTERGDQAAGILRQHDTLGVLPIPAFFCPENADFAFRNTHKCDIIEC